MKVIMFSTKQILMSLATFGAMTMSQAGLAADGQLIDSASVDLATGTRTQMLRLGVQKDWDVRWFQSNGTHLSGYWDASFGFWRANHYQNIAGSTQNLTDIGLDPVFRFERDDKKGMYAEGGIGVHRLSKLYDNDTYRLSTLFQFGDHIGVGYVFDNKWEVGAKIQHFSNGGYKKPNTGVNIVDVKLSYHF
ncbi:MAG: acyloxyacyl hydrolase [Pseudomonadota bacterium]